MKCISCHREISSKEVMVKFPCPRCDSLIVRCEKCRVLVVPYQCECGFGGP
ncbi:MAG: zinc finger domain-containing protein [Candidatus Methanofastidiosia archaeon]